MARRLDVEARTQVLFEGRATAHEAAALTARSSLAMAGNSELLAGSITLSGETAQVAGQAQAHARLLVEVRSGTLNNTGTLHG